MEPRLYRFKSTESKLIEQIVNAEEVHPREPMAILHRFCYTESEVIP